MTLHSGDGASTPKLLRRTEASRYLRDKHSVQRAEQTLAKYAVIGGGPRFVKNSRWPLYPTDELDRYAARVLSRLVSSTTELKAPP